MGNFWGFWLAAWWEAWKVLGLMEKEGSELSCSKQFSKQGRKHECSRIPQGCNVVNKDLILPVLIVGSHTKMIYERAPVCLLIVLASSVTGITCEYEDVQERREIHPSVHLFIFNQ